MQPGTPSDPQPGSVVPLLSDQDAVMDSTKTDATGLGARDMALNAPHAYGLLGVCGIPAGGKAVRPNSLRTSGLPLP
jgi:hypothetical protein